MKTIDKIFNNFKIRTKNTLSGTIVAHQKIGNNTVKVFISSYKPITRLSAAKLIAAKTDNAVISYPESLIVTEANNKYLGAVCCYKASRKYLFDISKVSQISANSFLDTDLGETWTKDETDGKTVFYRKNEDDINKVLSDLTLHAASYMKANIPQPTVGKNCYVKVFTFNGEPGLLIGKVIVPKDEVSVIEFGSSIKKQIPNSAIIQAYPYARTKKDVVEFDRAMEQPRGFNPDYDRAMDKMGMD